ncbi:MAG: hydroxymethylglutaryl-CoA lyase [Desulfatibacillaceae bacterium]|nr:hydroxymethylglutaryl-CoA lyase [Desulfatibacillaceae bacterium]
MTNLLPGKGLKNKLLVREVGPRDGFQAEKTPIPTELKIAVINRLGATGLSHIQAGAFVHPEKVPQMADSATVFANIKRQPSVTYSALVLNQKGAQRALDAGADAIETGLSISNTHSLNNTGRTSAEALEEVRRTARLVRQSQTPLWLNIQCAFGCAHEGAVEARAVGEMAKALLELMPDWLCLADTTGMADPVLLNRLLDEVLPIADSTPLLLHFHDTRGLGLVNVFAALQRGVFGFDSSIGGLGGCPFVPGATGNIASEDLLNLLQALGLVQKSTVFAVADVSRFLAKALNRPLPGKVCNLPEE